MYRRSRSPVAGIPEPLFPPWNHSNRFQLD